MEQPTAEATANGPEEQTMIKSVTNTQVYALLSSESQVTYEIPMYQREYSWSKTEWDALFDDLLEADGQHFLGTIICINTTVDTLDGATLELVDGQQRMTTLSLLLAAIYDLMRAQKHEFDDDGLAQLINLRKRLLRKDTHGKQHARLIPQVQASNRSDYLNVLSQAGLDVPAPKVSYLGVRRVKKCFAHFQDRIRGIDSNILSACQTMLTRVEQAVIVKIEVDNHADAFVLFESLNNRGTPLTPIDLIKNSLLKAADRQLGVDEAFSRWNTLLASISDDYGAQERFFRHYYNAFKDLLPSVSKAPVATRSNLIHIYEALIKADLPSTLESLLRAGRDYQRIIGNLEDDHSPTDLDTALTELARVQGAPSYILLLRLMGRSAHGGHELTEMQLAGVTRALTSFFVRRNLTGYPQTHGLPRLFMDLATATRELPAHDVEGHVRQALRESSSSDIEFATRLRGPVYVENTDVTRFILASIAEAGMTKETRVDLWRLDNKHYVWTIEHILPQVDPLPSSWTETLGGADSARELQQQAVHTLGNLTISGYNSHLGTKSFAQKRDRVDDKGNFIGFKNGLALNTDVVTEETWSQPQIDARTDRLAKEVLALFPL